MKEQGWKSVGVSIKLVLDGMQCRDLDRSVLVWSNGGVEGPKRLLSRRQGPKVAGCLKLLPRCRVLLLLLLVLA